MTSFEDQLDSAAVRAIEKRLALLAPYVTEHQRLLRRRDRLRRQHSDTSYSTEVETAILDTLDKYPRGLARSVIIEETGYGEHAIKDALTRLCRADRVVRAARGFYKPAFGGGDNDAGEANGRVEYAGAAP